MPELFETVTDLNHGSEALRRQAYGVIDVLEGQLRQVRLRPFPKIVSIAGVYIGGRWYHRHYRGDRCLVYYNQPRRHPQFLVLKYMVSARGTRYRTICRALWVLDEIARLKGSDALLCDVLNGRISHEMLARWGWVPHCPSTWHRHYIKRFYGKYPTQIEAAAPLD